MVLGRENQKLSVIGRIHESNYSRMAHSYSLRENERYSYEKQMESEFSKIFRDKVQELLTTDKDVSIQDKARIEELRSFYAETFCVKSLKKALV